MRQGDVVLASAVTGEGVDALRRAISNRMTTGNRVYTLEIDAGDGAALAWLHEHGEVIGVEEMQVSEEGEGNAPLHVSARLSDAAYARFCARG